MPVETTATIVAGTAILAIIAAFRNLNSISSLRREVY
jgi:hypothetical protein